MIRIGGMTAMTGIDFPGRLAAVLFLQGCPWRCGYCHNPDLLPARGDVEIPWSTVEAFLHRRQGLLDGVVFSGGEPTLQPALGDAVAAVRGLGFQVALHTGGMYPSRLAALLPALDWVGLDIKALPARNAEVTTAAGSGERVWRSLDHVLDSGIAYECRTTWHPRLYPEDELLRLADALAARGVRHWSLQQCRGPGYPAEEWQLHAADALAARFAHFVLRRA